MRETFVYVIGTMEAGILTAPCKCGITSSPRSRLASIRTGNPKPLAMPIYFGPLTVEEARFVESITHETYKRFRMEGEWFCVDPHIVIDHVATVISVEIVHPSYGGDEIEEAKAATALGIYAARMMRPVCNPDGSEYVGVRYGTH